MKKNVHLSRLTKPSNMIREESDSFLDLFKITKNTLMKTKNTLLLGLLCLSNLGFAQLDSFEITLNSAFAFPPQDGWMHFKTPNDYEPGACFDYYKTQHNDVKNDMLLIDSHTDNLKSYQHYKFQQLFMGVPVEGAGCIEHFDPNGQLIFTNAKHAIDINEDVVPTYNAEGIMTALLGQLPSNNHYAWEDSLWEQQIQQDQEDPSATWYPTPKLMLAIDEVRDMHGDIDGERYKLVYEISITTITPNLENVVYYVSAHDGSIFKKRSSARENVYADVNGYGNRLIDAEWQGGFVNKFYLKAADGNHNIHTKKYSDPAEVWADWNDTKSGASDWGSTYLTETSAHYHVTNTWDFFYNSFGRVGFDNQGAEIRVTTQSPEFNASYNPVITPGGLLFGYTSAYESYGDDPSVVAHEFVHGITANTANLAYEFQSGALNESFSDIFGLAVHALALDGGASDWIYGNFVPSAIEDTRSFIEPNTRGVHWNGNYNVSGNPVFVLGQPNHMFDNYFCNTCPYEVDNGGIHINSGVQNKWFHYLTAGSQIENVQGIGLTKATRITYFALTSILSSSSQFVDSKNATVEAAIILYGECSQEHISTAKAWNAVGLNAGNPCPDAGSEVLADENDVLIYPNPSNTFLHFELSKSLDAPVKFVDLKGKVVRKLEINSTHFSTDLSELERGIYFVHFSFNGQGLVKRIVLQ